MCPNGKKWIKQSQLIYEHHWQLNTTFFPKRWFKWEYIELVLTWPMGCVCVCVLYRLRMFHLQKHEERRIPLLYIPAELVKNCEVVKPHWSVAVTRGWSFAFEPSPPQNCVLFGDWATFHRGCVWFPTFLDWMGLVSLTFSQKPLKDQSLYTLSGVNLDVSQRGSRSKRGSSNNCAMEVQVAVGHIRPCYCWSSNNLPVTLNQFWNNRQTFENNNLTLM